MTQGHGEVKVYYIEPVEVTPEMRVEAGRKFRDRMEYLDSTIASYYAERTGRAPMSPEEMLAGSEA